MPAQDYPSIMRHLGARRAAQFTQVIDNLEAARRAGEIPNARYNDAKLPFSRAVEDAWEAEVIKPFLWNPDYRADPAERQALEALSTSPAPHLIASFDKKARALGDRPAGRAVRAFLDEIRPALELMSHCKTIAVKRKPKAAAPLAREVYSAPAAEGTAMGRVHDALQDITKAARDHLAGLIEKREKRILDLYMAAVQDNALAPEGQRHRNFSPLEYSRRINQGAPLPAVFQALLDLTEESYDLRKKIILYKPKANAGARLKERAAHQAGDICAAFVERNLKKLASIVETKGEMAAITVAGREVNPAGMEGRLKVSFSDESSFEVRTSVVWSSSALGTVFPRFPVTFHNVRTR